MGRVNRPKLSKSEKLALQKDFENSSNASYRKRCHLMLLKAQGRTSKDVGQIVGVSNVTVNSWLNRYKSEGIKGLKIKKGRGRKPLIDKEMNEESIKNWVKKHRQRVSLAQAEWEAETGKSVSSSTFHRFLKSLMEDINESENAVKANHIL